MPTCHACGGPLAADALTCPYCRASVRERDDPGSANVIALIVVIVILVIVGHDALAPGMVTKPAGPRMRTAARIATTKAAQRSSPMEHAPVSPGGRGLEGAQRTGTSLRR